MSASKRFAVVLAISAVAAANVAGRQASQTFLGRTDAILVDVQVTRNGRPVEGLSAADFVVRDSGVEQAVELLATGDLPVNLLLALDTSASVRGAGLTHLKDAARAAVSSLRPGDAAALLTFANNVRLLVGWTSSRDDLERAITAVTAQGSTALTDAAFAALLVRPKAATRTLILFFTDGDDTASWLTADDVFHTARRSNAVIYGVTIDSSGNASAGMSKLLAARDSTGDRLRRDLEGWMEAEPGLYRGALLPMLALDTGGEVVPAKDTAALNAAFRDIVTRFSRRYVLAYVPTGVPATGWHPLQVEVKNGGEVTARRGYSR